MKEKLPALPADPVKSVKAAGLRYVSDSSPGIRRKRAGKGFSYTDIDEKIIRDADELRRIKSLVIPPAWRDVWICQIPHGHLQATGRDAKGRKQHRYHPRWRAMRDETKYARLLVFGEALTRIREHIEGDLALPGLPREKVLATVVCLLETTYIRIGNAEYARTNQSFGLTTLRDRHVDISGSTLRFQFRGKSGVQHSIALDDRRLAKIVKRCQDIPGYELFQYLDADGERHTIDSSDVNEYLRDISGEDFTAKDFRTWAGTVLAMMTLREFDAFDSDRQAKQNIVRAIELIAARLGNTPSICRKCYVHPVIIEAYLGGSMHSVLEQYAVQCPANLPHALRPEELAVMAILRQHLAANNT